MLLSRVYAEQAALPVNISIPVTGDKSLPEYFSMAINLVMGFGVVISVIFLIMGGIQYITSKGDAKAAETARKSLTNAIIGTIIVVGVFALRSVMFKLLGWSGTDNNVVVPDMAPVTP